MTENGAIKYFRMATDEAGNEEFSDDYKEMCSMAIKAIEKVQAFEAIGTIEEFKALKNKHIGKDNMVISSSDLMTILNSDSEELKQYKEVGTVEEFKALKEKNEPMQLAEHNFQDEPHHYLCPCCRNIVSCNQNYCEECGQALET